MADIAEMSDVDPLCGTHGRGTDNAISVDGVEAGV